MTTVSLRKSWNSVLQQKMLHCKKNVTMHSHGTASNSLPSSAAFYAKSHPSMLQNFYRRKQCATPEFLKKATTMTFLWDLVTHVFFFQGEMLVCHSNNWYLVSRLHTKTQDSSPAITFNMKSASCTDHSRSPAAVTFIWYSIRICGTNLHMHAALTNLLSECSELIHMRCQFICYCSIITYQSDVMTV